MSPFSRRDFLKLSSLLSGALTLSSLAPSPPRSSASGPNILIFVFDAMSARNLSLYGYPRNTTPNLERFAARATVFHQHYSAANFTTPGTASLLTGLYPWTHRAINYAGLVERDRAGQNLFRALGNGYTRLAYSQNMWPNYLFGQFRQDIEQLLPPSEFSLVNGTVGDRLPRDLDLSHRAFDDFLLQERKPPGSLVFGLVERVLLRRAYLRTPAEDYVRGLPRTTDYAIFFRLRDVFDGLTQTLERLPSPFLAYLHTWSPHEPYRPNKDFDSRFFDGWRPTVKPLHLLGGNYSPRHMNMARRDYDEYVANVDFEFGRLLEVLSARGILDNSYVVVTSDHGELFERGIEGHVTPLLYEAVLQVPLLISAPGQTSRQDVNIPTSSIDVLPTLAHLSGEEVPAWSEGQILPSLGGPDDPERSIFMMYAPKNPAFSPLRYASFALRKGAYKLIYYKGFPEYDGRDTFELYDISKDPEELNDLYPQGPSVAGALQEELLTQVDAQNARMRA